MAKTVLCKWRTWPCSIVCQSLMLLSCYDEMSEEDVKAKRLVFDDALNGCGKRKAIETLLAIC